MPDLILGRDGKVATVRLARPPHNFFDIDLIRDIADALEANDKDPDVIVTLLSAEGRSFCAGADFTAREGSGSSSRSLYGEAERIFGRSKPLIAAINGPAVGGGLGLAVSADFRIASPAARFHCNFAMIGLHPGFALTATLPALIGVQKARHLMMSARRVSGEEAVEIGLADQLSGADTLDIDAMTFAQLVASRAPLALASIRGALPRIDRASARQAMENEAAVQADLYQTADFKEGVRANAERRQPLFEGR
ncbi:enoyl-CoA hydratase/isomerase family protein [Phenylobacterium sp.]|uniref:enoyl-CoA hydratase/isomerase family protein n=1 Tax=Phenylobacterium sp. TaxID=1871053 RepID=UPI0035AED180